MTSRNEMAPATERRLPDDNLCRTRIMGAFGTVAICLTENPVSCPHVSRYGKGYMCLRGLTHHGLPSDSAPTEPPDKWEQN